MISTKLMHAFKFLIDFCIAHVANPYLTMTLNPYTKKTYFLVCFLKCCISYQMFDGQIWMSVALKPCQAAMT